MVNFNINLRRAGQFVFKVKALNAKNDIGLSEEITVIIKEGITNDMNFPPKFKKAIWCPPLTVDFRDLNRTFVFIC